MAERERENWSRAEEHDTRAAKKKAFFSLTLAML